MIIKFTVPPKPNPPPVTRDVDVRFLVFCGPAQDGTFMAAFSDLNAATEFIRYRASRCGYPESSYTLVDTKG